MIRMLARPSSEWFTQVETVKAEACPGLGVGLRRRGDLGWREPLTDVAVTVTLCERWSLRLWLEAYWMRQTGLWVSGSGRDVGGGGCPSLSSRL